MMRFVAVLSVAFFASTAPALADTIHCESPDRSAIIDVDVEFNKERDGGAATRVRVETEDYVSSTDPSETEYEPDILAGSEVSYDRIQVWLESPNVGPTTFALDIVRMYDPKPGEEPDEDVVVGGAARLSGTTVTLVCSGW
jgi:hypothetical protein